MPPADLKALRAEFERGDIVWADLIEPGVHLDGLMDGTRVYVDPRPAIVETLLHELIHRRYPRWSERRVGKEAKELLCGMRTRQVNLWYRLFTERATRSAQPKRIGPDEL